MLHWLVYQQGNLRTVLIVEGSFIGATRLRADLETPGLDDHFVEGRELDDATAAKVPKDMVGRMLSEAEAEKLLERIARPGRFMT